MVSLFTCCVVHLFLMPVFSLVLLSCVTFESTERGHLPFTIYVGDNMHNVFYGITRLQPYIDEYTCNCKMLRNGLHPRGLHAASLPMTF